MTPRNPFYVLGLGADASPGDIEREGRKILGLFEVGAERAREYECALGRFDRDETMVRVAMAALRDPKRRAIEATLVRLMGDDAALDDPSEDLDLPLEGAFLVGGYRGL
jgi:hypothetical protein